MLISQACILDSTRKDSFMYYEQLIYRVTRCLFCFIYFFNTCECTHISFVLNKCLLLGVPNKCTLYASGFDLSYLKCSFMKIWIFSLRFLCSYVKKRLFDFSFHGTLDKKANGRKNPHYWKFIFLPGIKIYSICMVCMYRK